jgi:hypothetical protein
VRQALSFLFRYLLLSPPRLSELALLPSPDSARVLHETTSAYNTRFHCVSSTSYYLATSNSSALSTLHRLLPTAVSPLLLLIYHLCLMTFFVCLLCACCLVMSSSYCSPIDLLSRRYAPPLRTLPTPPLLFT